MKYNISIEIPPDSLLKTKIPVFARDKVFKNQEKFVEDSL